MRILLAAAGALCLASCAGITSAGPTATTTLKPTQGNNAAHRAFLVFSAS